MISENSLITELYHRGYTPDVHDVIKNGVTMRGLTIRPDNDPIAPCIYIDEMLEKCESPRQAADMVINFYESHRAVNLGCDISDLTNPEYITAHTFVGLQKTSDEDIVHRDSMYEGIEEFLYLRGEVTEPDGCHWSVKLKPAMIKELDEDELWKSAKKRTFGEFKIQALNEVIAGLGFDNIPDCPDMPNLYVISNAEKFRGAACACDVESIRKWAGEHDFHKLVVLPSSIHEMLIVPVADGEYDLDSFSHMVEEVNNTQVAPTERLTDRAYILNL